MSKLVCEASPQQLAFEHRVQGSDGVLRWVEHRGRTLRDATGKCRAHDRHEYGHHAPALPSSKSSSCIANGWKPRADWQEESPMILNNLLTVIMSYSELGRFALEPSHPSFEAFLEQDQCSPPCQRAAQLSRANY